MASIVQSSELSSRAQSLLLSKRQGANPDSISTGDLWAAMIALLVILISLASCVSGLFLYFSSPSLKAECGIYTELWSEPC